MSERPYEIFRTDKTEEQLADILAYLEKTAGNKTVLNLIDQHEQAFAHLSRFPYLGVAPRRRTLAGRGYRMLVVGRYLLFYKVDEARRRIIVYGVFHGAQDYEKWL